MVKITDFGPKLKIVDMSYLRVPLLVNSCRHVSGVDHCVPFRENPWSTYLA